MRMDDLSSELMMDAKYRTHPLKAMTCIPGPDEYWESHNERIEKYFKRKGVRTPW
jgi:hypothetical protein